MTTLSLSNFGLPLALPSSPSPGLLVTLLLDQPGVPLDDPFTFPFHEVELALGQFQLLASVPDDDAAAARA